MIKNRVVSLLLIFSIALLVSCKSENGAVSINYLLSNASTLNEKKVVVDGYVISSSEFEGQTIIWNSKNEADKRDLGEHILVGVLSKSYPKENWRSNYQGLVRISGIFTIVSYDPLNKYHLEEVTDVQWDATH